MLNGDEWSEKSLSASLKQANIRELEEEVKLLKNLKHPNIVVSVVVLLCESDLFCLLGA